MHTRSFCIFVLGIVQIGYCQCIDLYPTNSSSCLDIDTAWQRVIDYAPSIAAADAQISVLKGEATQVALRLNPIFEIESENLGITKPTDDVEPPQTTFSLAQTFELGGKRRARFRLASSLSDVAYWDAQIERENAYFALMLAFIEVGTAQERWKLTQEKLVINQCILETMKNLVQNGKWDPLDEKRRRVELMDEDLSIREVSFELEQAKARLASMWGSSCLDCEGVDFDLYTFCPPPSEELVLNAFYKTVDYSKAQQLLTTASQNLALQKSNRIPDITLMAGYRIFHDSYAKGWVVGFEMPIPFFNRNQGGVYSACCEITQVQFQLEEVVKDAFSKILIIHEKMGILYEKIKMISQHVLIEAKDTLDLIETGYQKGKYEYLDLLEAQKIFSEAQEKYIHVLYEYHLSRAELARLTGVKL